MQIDYWGNINNSKRLASPVIRSFGSGRFSGFNPNIRSPLPPEALLVLKKHLKYSFIVSGDSRWP